MTPYDRDARLEADIVETTAMIIDIDTASLRLLFVGADLPRTKLGHGALEVGWRITLASGEQGTITSVGKSYGMPACDVAGDFAAMLAGAGEWADAPTVEITIERFAANVVAIGIRE